VLACISGCAGSRLHQVQPNIESIDRDRTIVVFSIVTEKSIEGQELELVWRDENGKRQVDSITQTPIDGPLRLYVLEVPGHALGLQTVKIKVGNEWWAVYEHMKIELEVGAATYVGRMAIQDIQYRSGEGTNPRSIQFGFSDQSESDLAALNQNYAVFDEHTVSIRVPQEWGERSHSQLYVERRTTKTTGPGPTIGDILLEVLGAIDPGTIALGF